MTWLLGARFAPEARSGRTLVPGSLPTLAGGKAPLTRVGACDPLSGLVRPHAIGSDACDITRALRMAVAAARPMLPAGVEIRGSYAEVPALQWDGARAKQRLFNLLLDAAKLLAGPGTVELSTSLSAGHVRIAVRCSADTARGGTLLPVAVQLGRMVGDVADWRRGAKAEAARHAEGGDVLLIFLPLD